MESCLKFKSGLSQKCWCSMSSMILSIMVIFAFQWLEEWPIKEYKLLIKGRKDTEPLEVMKENKPIAVIKHDDPLSARVVVATLFTSTSNDTNFMYKGVSFRTFATNFQNYTQIHGYDLHIQTEIPNFKSSPLCKLNCLPIETKWYKIQVITNLLDKGYEWVFWTDADTLFTNLSQKLPIPLGVTNTEIIFCGDKNMVNTGHILLHNSIWTRKFLKAWWEMKKARHKYYLEDNSGLVVLLSLGLENAFGKNIMELERIEKGGESRGKITTQEEATSAMEKMHISFRSKVKIFPQNIMNAYPNTWKPGLLLVHLAGYGYADGKWLRKNGLV